jgi:alpha-glucosidase
LTSIPVRDGAALLLHAKPAYTTKESRDGPYSLLVSLTKDSHAFGTAYIDDGESFPPGPSRTLTITARSGSLEIFGMGEFHVKQRLQDIKLLGVRQKPAAVFIQGKGSIAGWQYVEAQEKLVLSGVNEDLNEVVKVVWK